MIRRRGIALVNVLIFASFTTLFVIAGIQFTQHAMKGSRKATPNAQVYNVARAGINHAVFWLQKQTVQPVTVFDPKANTNLPDEDPETRPTEEQLGLVNEFVIDAARNVWGRYEVGRSTFITPATARPTAVPTDGAASALYPAVTWTAEDVSRRRGEAQDGKVWLLRCRAYVFQKDSTNTVFSLAPDAYTRPRETLTLEAEARMASLNFRNAALYSFREDDGNDQVEFKENNSVKPRLEVETGATGRNYWYNTDDINNSSEVSLGTPDPAGSLMGQNDPAASTYVNPSLPAQLSYVFGQSNLEAVKGMADSFYTAVADVPSPLPSMSFVYLKGTSFTFNSSKQLNGGGILFVEGDLTIDGGSIEHNWDGLIFVTGDYTQKKKSTVTGSVMVGGYAKMEADSGKIAKITYSDNTLNLVKAKLGSYRMERSTLREVPENVRTF